MGPVRLTDKYHGGVPTDHHHRFRDPVLAKMAHAGRVTHAVMMSEWDIGGGTGTLTSFNGRTTPAVIPAVGDYTAGMVQAQGPVFNVTDPTYGAVGDNGVTDDTTAINGALAAAAASGGGQGSVAFMPDGEFGISNTILVPDFVTFRGLHYRASQLVKMAAFPAARSVTDFVTTSASASVSSATAAFVAGDVGRRITAGGVPYGAWILSVQSATTATMNVNATGSNPGGEAATFSEPPMVWLGYNTTTSFNCRLEGIGVQCNNTAGSIGVFCTGLREGSGGKGVLVSNFREAGIVLASGANGSASAVNSNFAFRDMEIYGGSGAWNGGIESIASMDKNILDNITINANGASGTRGIYLDGGGQEHAITNIHGEACTDLITIALWQNVYLANINGHSGITNVINVVSTGSNAHIAAYNIDPNGATNTINYGPLSQVITTFVASFVAGISYVAGSGTNPSGGTNTALSALATTPTLGAAAQLAQVLADATVYIDVTTAGQLTVAIGPTSGVANTIFSGTAGVGLITVKLPAGWFIAVTTLNTAAWTAVAITT